MEKIFLISLEYPPERGGIARYLHNIYSKSGSETIILAPKRLGTEEFDKKQNQKIYRKKFFKFFFLPDWISIALYAKLIFFKHFPKAIHISHVLPVGYVALGFKLFLHVPYRVYAHGMDVLIAQKSKWKKFWLKIILQNAGEIIANSNFTKHEIIKLGIVKDIKVVYPCVQNSAAPFYNSREWVNKIKQKFNLEDKRVILSVGRLVARKGFDKIIEAMPQILSEIPEVVYVVIGKGPYKDNLRFMVDNLELQKKVIFISEARDNELNAWYDLCDIFAMPARQIDADVEGFGIVFLEAGLRGKPVLGGKSGGIPEAIVQGKTGFLVDPLSIDEIAQNLIRLFKDDALRERMGKEGRERVMNEFMCE